MAARASKRDAKIRKKFKGAPLKEMGEHWRTVVEKHVPFALRWCAYWIPPKWYVRFCEAVMVSASRAGLQLVSNVVRVVCLLPFYGVKIFLQRFGTSMKLTVEDGKRVMIIKYFGRVVDRSEWKE
jgi:hypothetical protein